MLATATAATVSLASVSLAGQARLILLRRIPLWRCAYKLGLSCFAEYHSGDMLTSSAFCLLQNHSGSFVCSRRPGIMTGIATVSATIILTDTTYYSQQVYVYEKNNKRYNHRCCYSGCYLYSHVEHRLDFFVERNCLFIHFAGCRDCDSNYN